MNWSAHINSFSGKNDVVIVRYEDLLADPVSAMQKSLQARLNIEPDKERLQTIAEKYSFEAITKRKKGEENKKEFLRKGISGDWKNYFSKEACQRFNYYAGKELILLGYEKDELWV